MPLGSVLAKDVEERIKKKDRKKDKTTPQSNGKRVIESTATTSLLAINRCLHPTCTKCRKHTSCIQRPIEDGSCYSFEEGPAWDHSCKSKSSEEDDYDRD